MSQKARFFALAIVLVACSDAVGPKPPSAANAFVKVVSTVSRTSIGKGDTLTFTYSVENITNDSLTLTTVAGCQIQPELDQVAGARMEPPPLTELSCYESTLPTVSKLAQGEKFTYALLVRGFNPSKAAWEQGSGYLLTAGKYDASMLVNANEIGTSARSDWVRFEVK